jgi:hypothetical protein
MARSFVLLALLLSGSYAVSAQFFKDDLARDSARSDIRTGGSIRRAALVPGDPDVWVTIDLPSFQMTLWQNAAEVAVYPIGIGLADHPVIIGPRFVSTIEWNPVWIPPSSDWIERSSTVKPGEVVLPTDPRNPLGKVKLPLGYGYLIHQAKGPGDMGNLVSHGCVRVLQKDLYDLAEKVILARGIDFAPERIAEAKRTRRTMIVPLEPALPVEITYDTIAIVNRQVNIYPDVYNYGRNTVENLRRKLRAAGVDASQKADAELARILKVQTQGRKLVIPIGASGQPLLSSGKLVRIIESRDGRDAGRRR